MSARAAWRLTRIGFSTVFRYVGGKRDWIAAGLPTEGTASDVSRVGVIARRDVPVGSPREQAGKLADRARDGGWPLAVVTHANDVVLGTVSSDLPPSNARRPAIEAMDGAPRTVRADVTLGDLVHSMGDDGHSHVVVTDPDGRLIGVVTARDVVAHLPEGDAGP